MEQATQQAIPGDLIGDSTGNSQRILSGDKTHDSTKLLISFGTLSFAINLTQNGTYNNTTQLNTIASTTNYNAHPHTKVTVQETGTKPQNHKTLYNQKGKREIYHQKKNEPYSSIIRTYTTAPKNKHPQATVQKTGTKRYISKTPITYEGKGKAYQQTQTETRKADNQCNFVKIPPATKNWQKVVRKGGTKNQKKKQCYYCHRTGHIQRFCWKRIQCFTCGKYGHKFKHCLFKEPVIPPTNTSAVSNQITSGKEEQTHHHQKNPNKKMLHQRTPIGEIFRPPTTALNEQNDYLNNVGLVILIRGSPSPALPQLLANKMAETHGGPTSDYEITEASIAPYLLTCPSSQLRDAVVQRGMYNIPHANVQFAVHQWRPRFGMGHDPTELQAWVRITGLPLQAWTNEEIIRILENFGHTLEILPFGRAAGHHRHITALVATTNLNSIPLAYNYREGDYATQIEVTILSSRLWEDSNFPPPPDSPPSQAPSLLHRCLEHTPIPHPQRSSSSSSNNAPSEPSIDLSSWSPRSYRNAPINGTTPIIQAPMGATTLISIDRAQFQIILQQLQTVAATKNPTSIFQPTQTYPLTSLSLILTPNPITIKLHHQQLKPAAHADADGNKHDTATEIVTYLSHTLASFSPRQSPFESLSAARALLQVFKHQKALSPLEPPIEKSNPSPTQPKRPIFKRQRTQLRIQPTHPNTQPNRPHEKSSSPPNSPPTPNDTSYLKPFSPPTTPNAIHLPTQQPGHILDLHSPFMSDPQLSDQNQNPQQNLSEIVTLNQTQSSDSPQTHQTPTTLNAPSGKKKKPMATRKSQRLQEKQRQNQAASKAPPQAKAKTAKIPFELHSHEMPLNLEETMSILQASGLQITQQIENLVQEAAQKDSLANTEDREQSRPTTPLHDLIPPRAMPGDSILL